jgi:hypothetical protein
MSISLGVAGAVRSVLALIPAAPVGLSVIAVRELATLNYGRRGHEVLVHRSRARDDIVGGQMHCRNARGPRTYASAAWSQSVGCGFPSSSRS